MTIIAAIEDKDYIYIGSDSLCSFGSHTLEGYQKIHAINNYLVAISGSTLASQIFLGSEDVLPKNIKDIEDIKTLALKLKELFCQFGYAEKVSSNGEEIRHPTSFLICSPYGIWEIYTNYSLYQHKKYAANGSGFAYAFGSFFSTEGEPAIKRLQKAIKAAIKFDAGCGGRVIIKKIKKASQ